MRKLEPVPFTCVGCKAVGLCSPTRPRQYCSHACYAKAPKPSRRTGVTVACAVCSAPVYLEANRVARGTALNFCSTTCHDTHQGRMKVDRTCTVCTKPFRLSPSNAARTAGRYCSIKCRSACPVWRSEAAVVGNLKQMLAKGPNRLELAGRAILTKVGVEYREQVQIEGKFVVDVMLEGCPVVIQWDGDYWHGFRAAGDDRPLDARQEKRAALDRSQDAFMRSRGITVLRFWEHDMKHYPMAVEKAIRGALAKS